MVKPKKLEVLQEDLKIKKRELVQHRKDLRKIKASKKKLDKPVAPKGKMNRKRAKTDFKTAKETLQDTQKMVEGGENEKIDAGIDEKLSLIKRCLAEVKSLGVKIQKRKALEQRKQLEAPVDQNL